MLRLGLGCSFLVLVFIGIYPVLTQAIFGRSPVNRSGTMADPELTIYTYDSFIAPGGLGEVILPLFEKKTGSHVRVLSAGEGGQILTRLEFDAKRKKSLAQLVVGIDQLVWERAKPWLEEKSFLEYDYGILSLMVDRQLLQELNLKTPTSITDLLRPEWKRNLIFEDPRTSSLGLLFLLYTQAVLGQNVWEFWRSFKTQWLTLTPGWEGAYGLFLGKEAPLVWSYLSSQAYHEEHGTKGRYQAVLLQEGQPIQIEGAARIRGSFESLQQRELAHQFLEFLISDEVQSLIPQKNWMIPSRKKIPLPPSFQNLPVPTRFISIQKDAKSIQSALAQWNEVVD